MTLIHKHVLTDARTEVATHEGARFIHADNQSELVTVWAQVNPLARECIRTLYTVPTGGEVPAGCDYVGTALLFAGSLVFHVYADRETS